MIEKGNKNSPNPQRPRLVIYTLIGVLVKSRSTYVYLWE